MSKLTEIREDVQRVADAIASSLGLETEIVDEQLTIIAGTGEYKKIVGRKEEEGDIRAGFVYGRVIANGAPEIVEDAPNDPRYDPSVRKGTTKELAEVCYPILSEGRAIGVIGLVAFTETQRSFLLERKNQLLDFVHRMSELLAIKARERENLHKIVVASNQLHTILESIDNGILAMDKDGAITHCNLVGSNLIKKNKRDIIGQPIEKILPGTPFNEVLESGMDYHRYEVSYRSANLRMHFIVSINPVIVGNQVMGAVACFRDAADEMKNAYEMMATVHRVGTKAIWGESLAIKKLRTSVEQIALSNATVLITGETGTGKGLVATALHHSGPRLAGPFISINCSAIPDSLLESELFGYVGGAFSGARKGGKTGKFELADGGTIFLDEIGELPLLLQPKLLTVLQSKSIERLGDVKSIPIDVRVIASTNRSLEKMISDNEFRQDLFYRLNVIPIHIPPLRERKEDILLLANRFLNEYCRNEGKEIQAISPEVSEFFLKYNWPGNVRELQNTMEYIVCMAREDAVRLEDLPPRLNRQFQQTGQTDEALDSLLDKYEKSLIQQKLAELGDSAHTKEKLAELLKISRATLYRKLKKHELL